MTFCSFVGSGTSLFPIGPFPVIAGSKGENTPPAPACVASRAANGLSMGGSDGSSGIEGSPIEEEAGKEEGDAFIRACMNCCRCSGSQTEGSGGFALRPSKMSAFRDGVVPLRLGEILGEGETLVRLGMCISLIVSSPRKALE